MLTHPSSCRCKKLSLEQLLVRFSWARDYTLFRLDKIRTPRARAMEKALKAFCDSSRFNRAGATDEEAKEACCDAINRFRAVKADL